MTTTTRADTERSFRVRMRDRLYERLARQALRLGKEPAELASLVLERWARRQRDESERVTQAA
jgi:hypothetical protein